MAATCKALGLQWVSFVIWLASCIWVAVIGWLARHLWVSVVSGWLASFYLGGCNRLARLFILADLVLRGSLESIGWLSCIGSLKS